MKAGDVTDTLELALEGSGCDGATVVQKPRLLSDIGSSCVAADLADCLEDKGMDHVRGAPHHPQTQGKIERWHQTMKNRVLLENYFLPGDLERQIGAFVDHYNNHRYHESPANHTRRCLSGPRRQDPEDDRGDQETDNPRAPLAAPSCRRLN